MGGARSLGSAQQSVSLSCHDEHLSCPQSVWEEFLFFLSPLLRLGGGEQGKKREKEGREEERFQGIHERKEMSEGGRGEAGGGGGFIGLLTG